MYKKAGVKAILCICIALVFILPTTAVKNYNIGNGKRDDEYITLPPKEAKQMIESLPNVVILDVRTIDEYNAEHIKRAMSLPLSKLLCKSCFHEILDKQKEMQVLVYCNNGTRSKIAADILSKNGWSDIFILEGGFQKWRKEGFSAVSPASIENPMIFSESTYFTGCIPPNELDSKGEELILPSNVPSEWDWRNVDGYDWTTPAKNQGNCGSCWDFAAMGTLESVIKIGENSPIFNPDLSEQYLLSCPSNSGGCSGWSAYYAYEYIKGNGGAITEECFPYRANDNIPCSDKCSDWRDTLVPITDYGIKFRPGRGYMKNALTNYGPLVVCMTVYDDFSSYRGGIYEHSGNEPTDDINHEVVLVGYNDDPGYWICKNSWGKNWGEKGFFRIAYGDCQIEYYIIYVMYDASRRNWPPVADADGPYEGKIGDIITFDGSGSYDVDDNIVSYSWNFGDGTTGEGIHPTHQYSREGIFTVNLTVTDEEGKFDIDETEVCIDETPPTVGIVKPKERYLYILDTEIMSLLFKTRIIGGITVEVDANDMISGMNKVEFYLDDKLEETDYEKPYSWHWSKSIFWEHTLKVIAYDTAGNIASDEMSVWVLI